MAKLYYGSGNCSISGEGTDINGIQIHYEGAIEMTKTCPEYYYIAPSESIILIFPMPWPNLDSLNDRESLSNLFDYKGEFKIRSVLVASGKESVYTTIVKDFSYPELIKTKAEDMDTKTEDYRSGYVHGTKVRNTKIDEQYITNVNTIGGLTLYTKDGNLYDGDYNIALSTGVVTTGIAYTEESKPLYTNKTSSGRLILETFRKKI